EGASSITAHLEGVQSGGVAVTVSSAVLQALQVTPEEVSLAKGATEQLEAVAHYSDGSSHDVTSLVTWKSGDTSVVTVDSAGLVMGENVGVSAVSASLDGVNSVSNISVTLTPLEEALLSGDVKHLDSERELFDRIEKVLTLGNEKLSEAKHYIFSGYTTSDVLWHPNLDAIFMESNELNKDLIEPLLVSNTSDKNVLASIGFRKNSKFAHYFNIPISTLNGGAYNENMEMVFLKTLEWLNDESDIFNSHITITGGSTYWSHQEYKVLTNWFDSLNKNISYNSEHECNNGNALSCVKENNSSLVVVIAIGKDPSDINAILDSGVPVLFISTGGYNERHIGELFGLKYVGNARGTSVGLVDYNPKENELIHNRKELSEFFSRLRDGNYTFDASECEGTGCSNDAYYSEFYNVFLNIYQQLNQKSSSGDKMFSDYLYESEFTRLLVLISDWYRSNVEFPMNGVTGTLTTHNVLVAMVADGFDYINRELNHPRKSFGNYATEIISDDRVTTTIDINSTTTFRSSGYYALPGETFELTRLDSNDVIVKIQLNWFREGATKQWSDYNRPKYLNSRQYELKSGESIRLTSPLGGVIFVDTNKNDTSIRLKLENVVKHAAFTSGSSYGEFIDYYYSGERNWFDIVTPFYEWHIRKDKLEGIIENPDSIYLGEKGLERFIEYTNLYSHNYPRILAGQIGPGIDIVPEIKEFIESKGWSLRNTDYTQHSNNDQPNCGSGCSGNPIDSEWVPDPLSHGQIHELGHNLERAFAFDPLNVGHSVTNWYVYYSQTQKSKSDPLNPYTCADHGYNAHYSKMENWLAEAQLSGDHHAYMKAIIDDASKYEPYQLSEFLMKQLIMTAQNQGLITDGWNVIPRLHVHLDEFNNAKKSQADWIAAKDQLGFSMFTYDEAKNIPHNDYLAIAYSVVSELNLSKYFQYFGLTFDFNKVDQQLNTYGLSTYPTNGLYVIDNNICHAPYLARPIFEPKPYNNIALGKTVIGSSISWDMARAVDGNFDTHAETRNTGTLQWIEVDLGAEYDLDAIRVTNFNHDWYAHRFEGTIIVASDGTRSEIFNSGRLNAMTQYRLENPLNNIRYIKLYKENEVDMTVQTTQIEAVKY
ncbi:ImpA family metalloprotease, partial [Vibrio owensii]|uniref:ImpA family metalloprotease n=1 Tax=Vibrio owensii TaxID=696485 RepID=UPI004068389C